MFLNERLTEEEFNILANLSENIKDETVLDLISKLNNENIKDKEVIDCILQKHFKTALIMIQ